MRAMTLLASRDLAMHEYCDIVLVHSDVVRKKTSADIRLMQEAVVPVSCSLMQALSSMHALSSKQALSSMHASSCPCMPHACSLMHIVLEYL